MKVYIPNSAFLANLDPFLQGLDTSNPDLLEVTSHPEWISIHPLVLSMIAALGLNLQPENIHINIEAKSRNYLIRMGLFKILGLTSEAVKERAPEGRFIPLQKVSTSDELDHFITEMIPILHKDPEQSSTIGYIVSELVRNVLEHAGATHGAIVCAQRYPKSNSIRIGIVDTGVGIKATIGRFHSAPTDLAAIRLALWPGITGTTSKPGGTAQNAGAGLFFIRAIAHVNRDFFVIYSGNAFYKLLTHKTKKIRIFADPFDSRHKVSEALPYWQGTAVGIDISLDKTQEYDALLEAIKTAYYSLRKTKGPQKKPRFI